MMKPLLSTRDYEALSAYLDGELSPKDQARVEARLNASPDWRAGLEELRYSKTILHRVPMRRAPRNFTLKPSMVKQRLVSPAYPVFRLASVLASILLVVAFASDLLLSNNLGVVFPRSAAPAQPPAVQALKQAGSTQPTNELVPMAPAASTQAADMFQETQTPQAEFVEQSPAPALAVEAPTTQPGAGGVGPTATEVGPITALGVMPTPEGTQVGFGGGAPPDETEQASIAMTNAPPGQGGEEPEVTSVPPALSAAIQATEAPTEAFSEQNQVASSLAETETSPAEPGYSAVQPQSIPSTPFGEHDLLRVLEVVLGITAVGTGAIAIFLRMRSSS